MAEILMKYVDHVHPDPDTDRRGAYKQGDVVVVMPDGHTWGTKEALAPIQGGKFSIISAPDLTPEEAEEWAASELLDEDELGNPAVSRRRAWGLLLNELPPGIQTALGTPGATHIPIATLRAAMERKADGKRGNE